MEYPPHQNKYVKVLFHCLPRAQDTQFTLNLILGLKKYTPIGRGDDEFMTRSYVLQFHLKYTKHYDVHMKALP